MTDLKANPPKEKQTVPGLYVTAKEAYEKWKAEPEIMPLPLWCACLRAIAESK